MVHMVAERDTDSVAPTPTPQHPHHSQHHHLSLHEIRALQVPRPSFHFYTEKSTAQLKILANFYRGGQNAPVTARRMRIDRPGTRACRTQVGTPAAVHRRTVTTGRTAPSSWTLCPRTTVCPPLSPRETAGADLDRTATGTEPRLLRCQKLTLKPRSD